MPFVLIYYGLFSTESNPKYKFQREIEMYLGKGANDTSQNVN